MTTYRIPYMLTKTKKARTKARIAYAWLNGNILSGQGQPDAHWIELEAKSHAEAFRKFCAAVKPDDARPIQARWAIKYYAL